MPGLAYLHRLTVERPGSGSQNTTTGRYTPGTGVAVYDDAADVQDGQVAIAWDRSTGLPTRHAQAQIFLADEPRVTAFKVGDVGTVKGERYGDPGRDCQVVGTRIMDGVVFVDWIRGN